MLAPAVVTAIGGDSMMRNEAQLAMVWISWGDFKPDDADYDEYVDEEERDYHELIRNKSGNVLIPLTGP